MVCGKSHRLNIDTRPTEREITSIWHAGNPYIPANIAFSVGKLPKLSVLAG